MDFRTGAATLALAAGLIANTATAQTAETPATETGAPQPISNGATAQQTTSANSRGTPDQIAGSQDIVVTAQKSGAQTLQKVPLAIQAFSGEDLRERNITNVADLISNIPGAFESQRQSVASRSYSIRGAGAGAANGDSPIGYYIDDVPFVVTNFGIAPPIRFQDLDRVESGDQRLEVGAVRGQVDRRPAQRRRGAHAVYLRSRPAARQATTS